MNRSKLICLALGAVLMLPLWGCGSNRGAGPAANQTTGTPGNIGADPSGNAYVGADLCINCHKDPATIQNLVETQSLPAFAQDPDLVAKYLGSKHVVHSTHVTADSGEPCANCHNPVAGDASGVAKMIAPENVPAQGLAAVTCEACHGGGINHYGVGPLPQPTPDYTVCGKCHNQAMPESHNAHHPFGLNILANYQASKHFLSADAAKGGDGRIAPLCARCHTDEGFRQFAPQTLGMTTPEMATALAGKSILTTASPVQCRTCHDPHSGELRAQAVTATEQDTVDDHGQAISPAQAIQVPEYSASFQLCTTCHQVFLTATFDPASNSFSYALDPDKMDTAIHDAIDQFADSHFDNPNTAQVEGFNINAADERACLNCHDPHGATKFTASNASTIATEWAQTPNLHGDYQAEPFWYPQGAACAKCHSGSEFVKLTKGLPYSTANADGAVSYNLDAGQARVIACGSCHDLTAKNSVGQFALGAPRTFLNADGTRDTTFTFPSGTSVDLLGADANKLCLTCHSGRESGASVDAAIAAGPQSDGTYKFVNIHYTAAGATMYGNDAKGGYQYPGQHYVGKFNHAPSDKKTCIGCHMGQSGNHTFLPSPGDCTVCHGGSSFETLGLVNLLKTNIDTLKAELLTQLTDQGVTHRDGYPYFGNITTPAQLKATYNWQFADKDPASFIHNGNYVEQLLYDSIVDLGGTPSVDRPH